MQYDMYGQQQPAYSRNDIINHMRAFKESPRSFNSTQIQTLKKYANYYQIPYNEKEFDYSFSILDAVKQMGEGFLTGFSTFEVGKPSLNVYENLFRSVGQAAGFVGFIPSAPVTWAAKGIGLTAKTLGIGTKAVGTIMKFTSPVAAKALTSSIKSVPMAVAGGVSKVAGKWASGALAKATVLGQSKALGAVTNFLSNQSVQHIIAGGFRLGVASSTSNWRHGIDQMWKSFNRGFAAGAFSYGVAEAFGTGLVGVGKPPGLHQMKNGKVIWSSLAPSQKADMGMRMVANAMWDGLPETLRGASAPEQVYTYLLGAYFGYDDVDSRTLKAQQFLSDYSRELETINATGYTQDPAKNPNLKPKYDLMDKPTKSLVNKYINHHYAYNLKDSLLKYIYVNMKDENIGNIDKKIAKLNDSVSDIIKQQEVFDEKPRDREENITPFEEGKKRIDEAIVSFYHNSAMQISSDTFGAADIGELPWGAGGKDLMLNVVEKFFFDKDTKFDPGNRQHLERYAEISHSFFDNFPKNIEASKEIDYVEDFINRMKPKYGKELLDENGVVLPEAKHAITRAYLQTLMTKKQKLAGVNLNTGEVSFIEEETLAGDRRIKYAPITAEEKAYTEAYKKIYGKDPKDSVIITLDHGIIKNRNGRLATVKDISRFEFETFTKYQWNNVHKQFTEKGYYPYGGKKDKASLSYIKYHPSLEKINVNDAFDIIAKKDPNIVEYTVNGSKQFNVKKDTYKSWIVSNAMYELNKNGFEATLENLPKIINGKYGIISNAGSWNKRIPLWDSAGYPVQKHIFNKILGREKDAPIKAVIVKQQLSDYDTSKLDAPATAFKERNDGKDIWTYKALRAIGESTGVTTEGNTLKASIYDPATGGGALLNKSSSWTADALQQKWMEENGIDVILTTTTAKQLPIWDEHVGIIDYNVEKGQWEWVEQGAVFDINPEGISVFTGKQVDSHLLNDQSLSKPLITQLMPHMFLNNDDGSRYTETQINEVFNTVNDMYDNLVLSAKRGDAKYNDKLAEYGKTGNEKLFNELADNFDSVGINELIQMLKNPKMTKLSKRFLDTVTSQKQSVDETDLMEDASSNDFVANIMQENSGFSTPIERIIATSKNNYSAYLNKWVSGGKVEDALSSYFVNRLMKPKITNSAEAIIDTIDDYAAKTFAKDLVNNDRIFYLGKRHMDKKIKSKLLASTIYKSPNKEYVTLGEIWLNKDILEKNPETRSAMDDVFEALVGRVPMDSMSGSQLLKFAGFTNRNDYGIMLHGRVMQALGGADSDIDTTHILYFGGDGAFKNSWKKLYDSQRYEHAYFVDKGDTEVRQPKGIKPTGRIKTVGGFSPVGRGTPAGDGKDAAMRKVADSAIVELASDKPSSSKTTIDKLGAPTQTSKVIMLARNGSLGGRPLKNSTKAEIKLSADSGAKFIVGDMLGADTEFIKYLDEIGADYTVYHSGDKPRIPIKEQLATQKDLTPKFFGQMRYSYGDKKRNDISATTTIDAILSGERTATTRFDDDGNIGYWKKAKVGDIIKFTDGKGKSVLVEVTKPLHKLVGSKKTPEVWSKLEGWSTEYFNSNIKPKLDSAWQIEYRLAEQASKKNEGQPKSKFSWARKAENNYEVSSRGDKRFSPLYARLKDGRTIEEAYQLDVKNYRDDFENNFAEQWASRHFSGSHMQYSTMLKAAELYANKTIRKSGDWKMFIEEYIDGSATGRMQTDGRDWPVMEAFQDEVFAKNFYDEVVESIKKEFSEYEKTGWKIGKGKKPLRDGSKEQIYSEYKELWNQWAKENPKLIEELRTKANGKVLTDMFANTDNNQARALSEILNESSTKPDSNINKPKATQQKRERRISIEERGDKYKNMLLRSPEKPTSEQTSINSMNTHIDPFYRLEASKFAYTNRALLGAAVHNKTVVGTAYSEFYGRGPQIFDIVRKTADGRKLFYRIEQTAKPVDDPLRPAESFRGLTTEAIRLTSDPTEVGGLVSGDTMLKKTVDTLFDTKVFLKNDSDEYKLIDHNNLSENFLGSLYKDAIIKPINDITNALYGKDRTNHRSFNQFERRFLLQEGAERIGENPRSYIGKLSQSFDSLSWRTNNLDFMTVNSYRALFNDFNERLPQLDSVNGMLSKEKGSSLSPSHLVENVLAFRLNNDDIVWGIINSPENNDLLKGFLGHTKHTLERIKVPTDIADWVNMSKKGRINNITKILDTANDFVSNDIIAIAQTYTIDSMIKDFDIPLGRVDDLFRKMEERIKVPFIKDIGNTKMVRLPNGEDVSVLEWTDRKIMDYKRSLTGKESTLFDQLLLSPFGSGKKVGSSDPRYMVMRMAYDMKSIPNHSLTIASEQQNKLWEEMSGIAGINKEQTKIYDKELVTAIKEGNDDFDTVENSAIYDAIIIDGTGNQIKVDGKQYLDDLQVIKKALSAENLTDVEAQKVAFDLVDTLKDLKVINVETLPGLYRGMMGKNIKYANLQDIKIFTKLLKQITEQKDPALSKLVYYMFPEDVANKYLKFAPRIKVEKTPYLDADNNVENIGYSLKLVHPIHEMASGKHSNSIRQENLTVKLKNQKNVISLPYFNALGNDAEKAYRAADGLYEWEYGKTLEGRKREGYEEKKIEAEKIFSELEHKKYTVNFGNEKTQQMTGAEIINLFKNKELPRQAEIGKTLIRGKEGSINRYTVKEYLVKDKKVISAKNLWFDNNHKEYIKLIQQGYKPEGEPLKHSSGEIVYNYVKFLEEIAGAEADLRILPNIDVGLDGAQSIMSSMLKSVFHNDPKIRILNSIVMENTGIIEKGYFPHTWVGGKKVDTFILRELSEISKNQMLTDEAKSLRKLRLLQKYGYAKRDLQVEDLSDELMKIIGSPDGTQPTQQQLSWMENNQKLSAQNIREWHKKDWEVSHTVWDNYFSDISRKIFNTYSQMNNFMIVNKFYNENYTKMDNATLRAHTEFYKLYAQGAMGFSVRIPEHIRNDPNMHLKGTLYDKLSDDNVARVITKIGRKLGLLKDTTDVPVDSKVIDNLITNMDKFEFTEADLMYISNLEAQYQMASLLSHPKSYVNNVYGGEYNNFISSGFKNLKSSRDITYLRKINPEWQSMGDVQKWVEGLGVIEEFIVHQMGLNSEKLRGKLKGFVDEAIIEIGKNRSLSDKTLYEIASKYQIREAVVNKAAWFMRKSERMLRRDSFMTHYIHAWERWGGRLNYDNPWLIKQGLDGVKATQFLYSAPFKPMFSVTAAGKILTRFQLWSWNNVKLKREILNDAHNYGFVPGTEQFDRFSRMATFDILSIALANAFMYSIFDNSLPAPWNWVQDFADWIFGDEKERNKAFFGAYPPVVAPLQMITPAAFRLVPPTIKAFYNNDFSEISGYHIWAAFPFGRIGRDLMGKGNIFQNPYQIIEKTTGIPHRQMSSYIVNEAKKEPFVGF
jgi:hypothetical protein